VVLMPDAWNSLLTKYCFSFVNAYAQSSMPQSGAGGGGAAQDEQQQAVLPLCKVVDANNEWMHE
jgi:hypothetical protein